MKLHVVVVCVVCIKYVKEIAKLCFASKTVNTSAMSPSMWLCFPMSPDCNIPMSNKYLE